MKMLLIATVAWLCASLTYAGVAHAGKRVALVIGNSDYQHAQPLKNPVNDANAIAAHLNELGFEVVKGIDLTYKGFGRAIEDFERRLDGADVALFFFAGHGLQVKGSNYLMPVDAKLGSEASLDFEAVSLHRVLALMERKQNINLIILDACRDNPLARNLARNMGTRSDSIERGLASVKGGIGTLIAFSTQPGNVAFDGAGTHSPFAKALLKHSGEPGLDVEVVMRKVRQDVVNETARQQVPWSESSLTRAFVFRPKLAESEKLAEPEKPTQPENPARVTGPAEKAVPSGPAKPTGESAENTATGKTSRPDPDAGKPATTPAPAVPPVADEVSDRRGVAIALQRELQRVGCDPGTVDGVWQTKSRQALADFARHARRSINASEPTAAVLAAVRAKRSRVCPRTCDSGEILRKGKCVAASGGREPQDQPSRPSANYDGHYRISAVRTAHYRKAVCLSSYNLTLAVNGGGAAHKLPFGHTLRGHVRGDRLYISSGGRDEDGGWAGMLNLSSRPGGRSSGYLKWVGGGMICEFRLSATRG